MVTNVYVRYSLENAYNSAPEMTCFIIDHYFTTESYESVQQHFKNRFGDEYALLNSTIKQTVDWFKMTFTVDDCKQIGRLKANLVEKQEVCALLQMTDTDCSSVGSTYNILTHSLKLHTYRHITRQELKFVDYRTRLKFCDWFSHFTRGSLGYLDRVFFKDESWIHLDGYSNSQNYRI